MFNRLVTLVIKELQLALREPQSRRLLVIPVILQLLLFPFAASLEVKNATLVILNHDSGAESTELVQRLQRTQAFPTIRMVRSQAALTSVIDEQQALLGLEFPEDFSRALAAGEPATVLAVIDGRRSNSAQIAFGYAQGIVQDFGEERGRAVGRPVCATGSTRTSSTAGSCCRCSCRSSRRSVA
jgi:ABC-2 type transport system permease protein